MCMWASRRPLDSRQWFATHVTGIRPTCTVSKSGENGQWKGDIFCSKSLKKLKFKKSYQAQSCCRLSSAQNLKLILSLQFSSFEKTQLCDTKGKQTVFLCKTTPQPNMRDECWRIHSIHISQYNIIHYKNMICVDIQNDFVLLVHWRYFIQSFFSWHCQWISR